MPLRSLRTAKPCEASTSIHFCGTSAPRAAGSHELWTICHNASGLLARAMEKKIATAASEVKQARSRTFRMGSVVDTKACIVTRLRDDCSEDPLRQDLT